MSDSADGTDPADHDDFLRRWHAFARSWQRADVPQRATLVDDVLRDGLPEERGEKERDRPPAGVLVRCEKAVIKRSGAFDVEGYAAAKSNRVVLRASDPLTQFVTDGWRELRAPSLDFDLWWYWCEYLDPTREDVNPLLHYLLGGRRAGHRPRPGQAPAREPARLPTDRPVRRACLFAAYDRDGKVDDYVVTYLRELSAFADVYYLADGVLDPGELDKLDGVVAGAWSIPHAAYDFGSYSMLARDLVGWERVATYDELILANDSCFLLRPLADTFAAMDARACDWWGLQATSMEFNEDDVDDPEAAMPLAEAKAELIGPRRWSEVLYLHLSSYFLVFRKPVVDDPGFRARLDAVCGQADKMSVVHKYEIGISRYLMDSGFDFDTLLGDLYPFHPLYSRRFFGLAERGFPLVKRNFLAENPRYVADFGQWPEWLAAAVPDAPLAAITANIERVSPYDVRQAAAQVRIDPETGNKVIPERARGGYAFRTLSRELAKFDHWWAFPVAPRTHQLSPGAQAVFETVRDDPSIRKVVLTRSRRVDVEGENVVVLPAYGREAQPELARCGQVLVDGDPAEQLDLPMPAAWHKFVHVGTGLPISAPASGRHDAGEPFESRLASRAVASRAEALARAAQGAGAGLDRLWVTGLPRHDFVTRRGGLPADLERQESELRARVGSRRLVVFWPRTGGPDSALDPAQLAWLSAWAVRHDVILGVREELIDRRGSLTERLGALVGVGVAPRSIATASPVLRVADVVVTDDADDAVDFLLTGRPLVHWLPEGETPAAGSDVAAYYPPEEFLPGPVCRDFDALSAALEVVFEPRSEAAEQAYARAAGLAFAHTDDLNGSRLAWRMRGQVD